VFASFAVHTEDAVVFKNSPELVRGSPNELSELTKDDSVIV